MTVAELIEHLKTFPHDLKVTYQCCSETVLLEVEQVYVVNGCPPRPDGWVQNERPDVEPNQYVRFPGN